MNRNTLSGHRLALAVLALLMALTRFHHEGTAFALPDASLSVFFLAGIYLKSLRGFACLFALAVGIDSVAIAGFGVSDYCVSPAYVFLLPTYAVMWHAGRWLSRQSEELRYAYWPMWALALGVSASMAFVVSNGSFFWLSGKLSTIDWKDYAQGLSSQYLPYVGATALYATLGRGAGVFARILAGSRFGRIDTTT